MTSTPSHLTPTRLRPAEDATTPSVPTHVKRVTASRRSKRKAKAALTKAVKSPKKPKPPAVPMRPSGYKAPTNRPHPIRSPTRGDPESMSEDEGAALSLDPILSRPAWVSRIPGNLDSFPFAGESSTTTPQPQPISRRSVLDRPEILADLEVFELAYAYAS